MSKHASTQHWPATASATTSAPSIAQRQHTLGPHRSLQRDAQGSAVQEPINKSAVEDVLQLPGQPLDRSTRALMEPHFGYDFSQVRVHTDAQAARSAEAVHAAAYTAGQNVVFGAGRYTPGSAQGQQLMAHELTHVMQQASGRVAGTPVADGLSLSHPSDPQEQHAQANAMNLHGARTQDRTAEVGTGVHALRSLPNPAATGQTHLQRSPADDATVASAGIAGASLGLGILGTIFAGQSASAAGRQAEAAEAASVGAATAGGLVINHTDIPPGPAATTEPEGAAGSKSSTKPAPAANLTASKAGAKSTPAAADTADSIETERDVKPLLRVGIGDASSDFALIGVALRAKGKTITGGQTETIDSDGYIGGLSGNNLFVTLRAHTVRKQGIDVTRITYEGTNSPARHGASSRVQRFNGVIMVDATSAIIGDPNAQAKTHGGDKTGQTKDPKDAPLLFTTPRSTR